MRKSVLVTGSAKRIGRRLALDFAKDGWDVAVHCNASLAEAEEVAGDIRNMGCKTVIVRGNLSEADVPDRLIAEASAALGGLSCLINNASLFEPDEVGTITSASWADHLDTNLRAPVPAALPPPPGTRRASPAGRSPRTAAATSCTRAATRCA